jgi:hypothetical protein
VPPGPVATISAPERRHRRLASRAKATCSEANGIDCGASLPAGCEAGTAAHVAKPRAMKTTRDVPPPGHWRFRPSGPRPARFEHLDDEALGLLRALAFHRVDHVVVGPVAAAVHGAEEHGPLAIVPAPYARNYAKLATALRALRVTMRVEGEDDGLAFLPTAEALRVRRTALRCEDGDLDVVPDPPGTTYGELLADARREELEPRLYVDVAAASELTLRLAAA